MNRIDLQAETLVGHTGTSLVLDPLAQQPQQPTINVMQKITYFTK